MIKLKLNAYNKYLIDIQNSDDKSQLDYAQQLGNLLFDLKIKNKEILLSNDNEVIIDIGWNTQNIASIRYNSIVDDYEISFNKTGIDIENYRSNSYAYNMLNKDMKSALDESLDVILNDSENQDLLSNLPEYMIYFGYMVADLLMDTTNNKSYLNENGDNISNTPIIDINKLGEEFDYFKTLSISFNISYYSNIYKQLYNLNLYLKSDPYSWIFINDIQRYVPQLNIPNIALREQVENYYDLVYTTIITLTNNVNIEKQLDYFKKTLSIMLYRLESNVYIPGYNRYDKHKIMQALYTKRNTVFTNNQRILGLACKIYIAEMIKWITSDKSSDYKLSKIKETNAELDAFFRNYQTKNNKNNLRLLKANNYISLEIKKFNRRVLRCESIFNELNETYYDSFNGSKNDLNNDFSGNLYISDHIEYDKQVRFEIAVSIRTHLLDLYNKNPTNETLDKIFSIKNIFFSSCYLSTSDMRHAMSYVIRYLERLFNRTFTGSINIIKNTLSVASISQSIAVSQNIMEYDPLVANMMEMIATKNPDKFANSPFGKYGASGFKLDDKSVVNILKKYGSITEKATTILTADDVAVPVWRRNIDDMHINIFLNLHQGLVNTTSTYPERQTPVFIQEKNDRIKIINLRTLATNSTRLIVSDFKKYFAIIPLDPSSLEKEKARMGLLLQDENGQPIQPALLDEIFNSAIVRDVKELKFMTGIDLEAICKIAQGLDVEDPIPSSEGYVTPQEFLDHFNTMQDRLPILGGTDAENIVEMLNTNSVNENNNSNNTEEEILNSINEDIEDKTDKLHTTNNYNDKQKILKDINKNKQEKQVIQSNKQPSKKLILAEKTLDNFNQILNAYGTLVALNGGQLSFQVDWSDIQSIGAFADSLLIVEGLFVMGLDFTSAYIHKLSKLGDITKGHKIEKKIDKTQKVLMPAEILLSLVSLTALYASIDEYEGKSKNLMIAIAVIQTIQFIIDFVANFLPILGRVIVAVVGIVLGLITLILGTILQLQTLDHYSQAEKTDLFFKALFGNTSALALANMAESIMDSVDDVYNNSNYKYIAIPYPTVLNTNDGFGVDTGDEPDGTLSNFEWVGFCAIEAVNLTFNNLQNDTLGNTRDRHYVKGTNNDNTRSGIALVLSKLVYMDGNGASFRTPTIDMSNSTETITYFINYIEPFILEDNSHATHIDKSWFGNTNTTNWKFLPHKKVILKMSQNSSNVLMINTDQMNLSKYFAKMIYANGDSRDSWINVYDFWVNNPAQPLVYPTFMNCVYELHGDKNNITLNFGSIENYYTKLTIDLRMNNIDDRLLSGSNLNYQSGRMYVAIVACNSSGQRSEKLYQVSQLIPMRSSDIYSHGRELFVVSSGYNTINLIQQEVGYEDKISIQASYKDTINNPYNNTLAVIL